MYEKLHSIYPSLYGTAYNEKEMDERFSALCLRHEELFGVKNPMIFSSAGRTEIAGNHTDHNLGLVIGASINLDTVAAVSRRDDRIINFSSEGFPSFSLNLDEVGMRDEEKNTTQALVRGIADAFQRKGVKLSGWNANVSTTVAVGSGLSSSASVEVLIAEIFNHISNNDACSPLELARISQYAENHYFGKPSGLLDQVCCATGGVVGIDFRDRENPLITKITLDLSEFELTMIITNTRGCHANLTDEYASVPAEMRQVAAYFGKENLRDVGFSKFMSSLKELREELKNDRAILRAYHFFTENERVSFMLEEIRNEDIDTFLYNVNESGTSSFCFLQNVYPSSHTEQQGLPLAIALSQQILQGEGAVRLHGGGFAGTIQAYVPDYLVERYVSTMESIFGKGSCTRIAFRKRDVSRII